VEFLGEWLLGNYRRTRSRAMVAWASTKTLGHQRASSPLNIQNSVRVYLVRHGEVEDAWRGKVYGCHDVALSDKGELEARSAADRLAEVELAAVVSSGLRRTEFGAACIRETRDLRRQDDRDLREIERGSWVGRMPEEIEDEGWRRWQEAPDVERPPGGENLQDLAGRVLPRIGFHGRELAGKTLAIVAHSWVLRVSACAALGWPLSRAPELVVPTGSILALDWPLGWPTDEGLDKGCGTDDLRPKAVEFDGGVQLP
jgi:broad specificity phosphatase PhoE